LFLLAESVRSGRAVVAATAFAIVLYFISVLSHEANAFFVLPFVLLLRRATGDGLLPPRVGKRATVGFLSIAAGGLLLAFIAPGTFEQQRLICEDLLLRGFDANLCRGSLSYIGEYASSQALRIVFERLPGDLLYSIPAMFAVIPFLFSPWAREHWRKLVFAIAPIGFLFLIAIDWGRWIMLATVITTVLTVVGSSRDGVTPTSMPIPLLGLFVVGWSMPHVGIGVSDVGSGELIGSISWALQAMRQALLG